MSQGFTIKQKQADGTYSELDPKTVGSQVVGAVGDSNMLAGKAPTFWMPTGVILPFGGTTEPSGWLVCNGAAVSRTAYAALFSVIGTTYGVGDGATTFDLPDLRGRVPLGYDANYALGSKGGAKEHKHSNPNTGSTSLTVAQIPSHYHDLPQVLGWPASGDGSAFQGWSTTQTGANCAGVTLTAASGDGQGHTHTQSDTGVHSSLQPYIAVNYIIKI